jgi:Protein of unknown function (DUF3108)
MLLLLPATAQTAPDSHPFPRPETLDYNIEWRLIDAGMAKLTLQRDGNSDHPGWDLVLHLLSAGLVSKLYKVDDTYTASYTAPFCVTNTHLIASEGHRQRDTRVTFDQAHGHAYYLERDLKKNSVVLRKTTPIPACVHDVLGALAVLRTMHVEAGKSVQLPISTGKKTASVRVEAQDNEELKIKDRTYKTVRYEAYVFNNILYSRKARLLVWLTADENRLPVQVQVRMGFPVGSVTLTLDKIEP